MTEYKTTFGKIRDYIWDRWVELLSVMVLIGSAYLIGTRRNDDQILMLRAGFAACESVPATTAVKKEGEVFRIVCIQP